MGLVKYCQLCGKKIMGMRMMVVNKGTPEEYTLHPECAKAWMNAHGFFPTTRDGFRKKQNSDVKVKCNTCGHLYCYNVDDIQKNRQLAKQAVADSVAGLGQAIGGTYTGSKLAQMSAENKLNRIVDYSRCPKCNSSNVRVLTDAQWEAEKQNANKMPMPAESAPSALDEIKKLKELLDIGAVTQEEYDAKKKELLGIPSVVNEEPSPSNDDTVTERKEKAETADDITSINFQKLEFFKKLYDEGKITEKEFVNMRKMIIGQ